jgi:hypothetical protein
VSGQRGDGHGANVPPSFIKVPVRPQRVSGGVDYFSVGIRASENGAPLSGSYHELAPPSSYADNHPEYDPGDESDSDTGIAYFSGSACTSGVQLLSDTAPGPELHFTATGLLTAAYLVVVSWSGPPAQSGPTLREDRGGSGR